jgi:hypothetical protein
MIGGCGVTDRLANAATIHATTTVHDAHSIGPKRTHLPPHALCSTTNQAITLPANRAEEEEEEKGG